MEPMTTAAILGGYALINAGIGWWTNKQKQDEMRRYLAAMEKLQKKIENEWAVLKDPTLPQYDMAPLTAEEYSVIGKYAPQIAQQVVEKRPQMLDESASSFAKSAQYQALQQYREKARGGETAQARASRAKGMYEADASSRQALDRILAQTGGDRGTQAVLAAQAGQGADQNRYMAALNASAMDEQAQMQALQNMAGLSGDIRNQNYRTEAANADIINSFNQRAAQNQWIYNQEKARTQNNAQMYNLENRQRVADANVGLRNQVNMANRKRYDDMARETAQTMNDWNFQDVQNQNNKLKTLAGVSGDTAAAGYKGGSDYFSNMGQGFSHLVTGLGSIPLQVSMYDNQTGVSDAQKDYYKAKTDFYNRRNPQGSN
jgi:hypothetical protein